MQTQQVAKMVMDADTVTTIMNNLNSIYSNAFGQLITYTVGILALVGVIIPIAISFFQNKQLKADNLALTNKITSELEDAKRSLIADLKLELSKEIHQLDVKIAKTKTELEENITTKSAGLNAKAHHAQGNVHHAKNDSCKALEDYLIALADYATAKDEGNIQAIFLNLGRTLPKLTKSELENKDRIDMLTETALAQVKELNTNNRYSKDIRDFEEALKSAKSRATV